MGNRNTNFRPCKGQWTLTTEVIVASVAMQEGSALATNADGTLIKATASTTNHRWILAEPIAATDADYATAGKKKAVWRKTSDDAECEFTVGAGTFTSADVNKGVKFYDEVSLGVDTAGTQALITAYISSTRGRCILNSAIA